MKIITTTELLDIKGNQFEKDKPMLLGDIVANMLATSASDNPAVSYQLAKKFATVKELDITADDIVFIKKQLVASSYLPIITGQIIEILEK